MAIEQLVEAVPEGLAVKPEPPAERSYADVYAVAAICLIDAIRAGSAVVPEMTVEGLDELAHAIQGAVTAESRESAG